MKDDVKKPMAGPLDSIEFEQYILGCLMAHNDLYYRIAGQIKPHHFSEELHVRMFEEMVRRMEIGERVTVPTIAAAFPNIQIGPGGMRFREYLIRLSGCTDVVLAIAYVPMLQALYTIRTVGGAAVRLAGAGNNGIPPDIAVQEFFAQIDALRLEVSDKHKKPPRLLSEHAYDLYSDLSARLSGRTKQIRVPTTYDLDRLLGGLGPGDLVIAAGRPGMGKTVVGVSFAHASALDGYGGAFFSMEMSDQQITARFLAEHIRATAHAKVPYNSILNEKTFQMAHAAYLEKAEESLRALPLMIDATSSLTVGELGAKARRIKSLLQRRGSDLHVIWIDYLKYMRSTDRYRGNKVYEIGEITGGLKILAKELNIPIVVLHQLNREVEKRENKRPTLSDLRDSGEIEQDADVVLFLFRQGYYAKNSLNHDFEIDITKHRNGPTGVAQLWIDVATSSVRNQGFDVQQDQVDLAGFGVI